MAHRDQDRPGSTDPALGELAELLNRVFATDPPYTAASLHWHYVANPEGPAALGQVHRDGQPIGNYALVPQRLADATGSVRRVGVGVDLAVDPAARGAGTFRATVEDAYRRGRDADLDAIVGVANANSAPRMVHALGWQALDPLPLTLWLPRPGPTMVDSRPATPELACSRWFASACGSGFAAHASEPDRFEPIWDAARLAWRLTRPGRRYVVQLASDHLAVSTATRVGGIRCAVVLKVLARSPVDHPIPRGVVAAATARAHRTPLVIHWGRNPAIAGPALRLPARWMPSPLSLVAHPLRPDGLPADFALGTFELLDFDAF